MREHVGEPDRHERVREAVASAARVLVAAADAANPDDAEPIDAGDQRDAEQQAERVGELDRRRLVKPKVGEAVSAGSARGCARSPPLENPSKVVVPMIVQISATVPARIGRLVSPLRGRRR